MLHCPAGPSRTQRSAVAGCGSPGSQFWQLSRLKASPRGNGPASAPSIAEKPIHTSRPLHMMGRVKTQEASQRQVPFHSSSLWGQASHSSQSGGPCPYSPDGEPEVQRHDLESKTHSSAHPAAHAMGLGAQPRELASIRPTLHPVRRPRVRHLETKTPTHQSPKGYSPQLFQGRKTLLEARIVDT